MPQFSVIAMSVHQRTLKQNTFGWKGVALIGSACLAAFVLWADAPKPAIAKHPTLLERVVATGNSLGMKFVPIPDVPNGLEVLGCIHETRSKDFAAFIADKDRGYEMTGHNADSWRVDKHKGVPIGRGKDEKAEDSSHPVCSVSYYDAQAFCVWLTKRERAMRLIGPADEYRLPSDLEWSLMVGLGREKGDSPAKREKNHATDVYPWGGGQKTKMPPTTGAGNYADETAKAAGAVIRTNYIKGYTDGYATTAPVMSFSANSLGFYDLGGNNYEWCEDWYDGTPEGRVFRGASWGDFDDITLLSSSRFSLRPELRYAALGFRCVLAGGGG